MKKLLYDAGVILCIAAILPLIAVWSGIVAIYYTCTALPGELLILADRIYYDKEQ
jgi:hypothetical protein